MAARHIALLVADLQSGGAQRQAAFLAAHWAAQGDRVSILTYEAPGARSFFPIPESVSVYPLGLAAPSAGPVAAAMANFARVKAVRQVLADIKPDCLLAFLAEMTVTGFMAAAPLRVPVYACERTDPAVYPRGIWRPMRNIVFPRCAKIICQKKSAADYFGPAANTVVIPNPVSRPPADGPADIDLPEKPFIATLGRLSPEKGHDVLIEAFAQIAPLYPQVDLLIIGEGPARAPLEHLAAALNIAGRVHMPGASRQPFPVLARAQVFVLPSRFEGFPNALAEAMALGVPPVATRFSGVEEIIRPGHNGLLVPVDDAGAMAAAMAQLLQNPDQAQAMGQAARAITDEFAPARIMALWDDALSA